MTGSINNNFQTPAVGGDSPSQQENQEVSIVTVVGVAAISGVAAFFIALALGISAPLTAIIVLTSAGVMATITALYLLHNPSDPPVNEIPNEVRENANEAIQKAQKQIAEVENAMAQKEPIAKYKLYQEILKIENEKQQLEQKYLEDRDPEELERLYLEAQQEYDAIPKNPENQSLRTEVFNKLFYLEPKRRLKRLEGNFQYEKKRLNDQITLTFHMYTLPFINDPEPRERILEPYREKYGILVPS